MSQIISGQAMMRIWLRGQQIDVLAYYEGEPDCELALPLTIAPELNDKSNLTRLIKEDKLEL